MPPALTLEHRTRANKTNVKTVLRALQPLARATLGTPVSELDRSRALPPAEFAERMRAARPHVQALLALFGVAPATPAAAARRQAAAAHLQTLIAQGELIASAQFVEELQITRQGLSKALTARRVFYLDLGGERYFPSFFLDRAYDRQQLEHISKLLGDLSGASKLQFFTTGKASLSGQTPLQALAKGKYASVRAAAAAFAEA